MITSPSEGARRDPALGDDWLDLPRALGGNPSKNNEKKISMDVRRHSGVVNASQYGS